MTIKTLAWIFKVVYRTFCNAKDFSIFVLFSKCGVFQQNRHKTYVEETVKGEGGLEFCDRRGDWGRDLCDWTKKAETILSYVQTCRLFPTRPVMRSGCGWSVGHSPLSVRFAPALATFKEQAFSSIAIGTFSPPPLRRLAQSAPFHT